MEINDWLVIYLDSSKEEVETLELYEIDLEEAKTEARANMPDEAFSFKIEYLNNEENELDFNEKSTDPSELYDDEDDFE